MKKFALALMATSAALFGFSAVASAQTGYEQAVQVNPATVGPGGAYSVTYVNCVVGETVTFNQPESTPTTLTAVCQPVAATIGSSIVGLLIPQAASLGSATVTFTNAPMTPATYPGTAVGQTTPNLAWTVTVVGQAPTTTAPTTATPQIPTTGSSGIGATTGIAIGLLAVGLGLFAVAQVRRRQVIA